MNNLIKVVGLALKQLISILLMWLFTAIAFVFLAISTVLVSMMSLVTGVLTYLKEYPKLTESKAVKQSSVQE